MGKLPQLKGIIVLYLCSQQNLGQSSERKIRRVSNKRENERRIDQKGRNQNGKWTSLILKRFYGT